jgi:NodT family efflux transporter outer membrane factor (OMF) lipoprotein
MRRAGLLIALLLGGCAQTPPLGLKQGDVPAAFDQSAPAGAAASVTADWWKSFGNNELTSLVETAQGANLDIAQAEARLLQADARARQAGAVLLPSVALNGNVDSFYGHSFSGGGSSNETDFSLGLGASYELDFWGKNRAAADSASALRGASAADRATVALTASAAVANSYFQLLSLRERLSVARANLQSSQDILRVVQRRVDAGYAPSSDLTQERANLAAQQAAIPPLEQQELETRNALAILTGRVPEGFNVQGQNLAGIADPVVAPGLPSALLTRRPDILTAELNLASAHADVAAARAAMLPDITLTAAGGIQNPFINAAVNTLPGTGLALSAGASLVQTIFDGGKLQAKTDETLAREQELLAAYRAAVFNAFGDVENALGNLGHLQAQETALADQVTQSEGVLRAAQRKYAAGAADFLVVTDAERSLYAARDQLSDIRRARLTASVALYRALGGGWTNPEAKGPAETAGP